MILSNPVDIFIKRGEKVLSEIDLLLLILSASGYLNNACIITSPDNTEAMQANSVLMSLNMTVHKHEYAKSPYIFLADEEGSGRRVPNIIMYTAPPVSVVRQGDSAMLAWDRDSSPCNRTGLEHFKISGWNNVKNPKGRRKVSSCVEEWRRLALPKQSCLKFMVNDPRLFHSNRDIGCSFENGYRHHIEQIGKYYERLGTQKAPIGFIIECDDTYFLDNYGFSLPIFVTSRGLEIIQKNYIPDGIIFFGIDGLWLAERALLKNLKPVSSTISLPVCVLYQKMQDGWYLQQESYWNKIS